MLDEEEERWMGMGEESTRLLLLKSDSSQAVAGFFR